MMIVPVVGIPLTMSWEKMSKIIFAIQNGYRNSSNTVIETLLNGWYIDKIDVIIEQNKKLNNWEMLRYINNYEELIHKTENCELSSLLHGNFHDNCLNTNMLEVKLLDEISEGEKYVFPFSVFGSGLLETPIFIEQGINLPERVLSDAKNGNCKILLHELCEGHGFNNTWVQRFITAQVNIHNIPFECFGFADGSYQTPELQKSYNTQGFFVPWWESHSFPLNDKEVIKRFKFLKNPIPKNKYFLALNRRIRPHRSVLAYNIIKNWEDKFLWSYDLPPVNVNIFDSTSNSINHYDDMCIINGLLTKEIYNQLPRRIDIGPEVNDTHLKFDLIDSVFINVTTETFFFENNMLFFSEKIFKPLLSLQPFILLGNAHSLALLREMGYKTFHPFINEEYDSIDDGQERMNCILAEIDRLSKFSQQEMLTLIDKVSDICIHNYFHIINSRKSRLREKQFLKLLFEWVKN